MIVFDSETEGLPVISQFSEYRISALLLQQVVVIAIVTWIEYDEYCMYVTLACDNLQCVEFCES